MKRFVFILFCSVMLSMLNTFSVCAQKHETVIKIAATSNLSDAPADEALKKMEAFLNGDSLYELNAQSPISERKAAVKMAFELCVKNKISYNQYADICKALNIRPKPISKVERKKTSL